MSDIRCKIAFFIVYNRLHRALEFRLAYRIKDVLDNLQIGRKFIKQDIWKLEVVRFVA